MKEFLKKSWPHAAAIVFFVIITIAYFSPLFFEGKGLVQGDIVSALGWGQDSREVYQQTGEFSHWSNGMFGGMPYNYTFGAPTNNVFGKIFNFIIAPFPNNTAAVLFLYLIGFYVFMISMGASPLLAVIGAVAYALGSYNIIIIEAGHVSKGLVMATMAPLLGGIMLCYRKKYLWGALITLISAGLNVYLNHQQISYYLLIMIIALALVYFVQAIKQHSIGDYFKSSAVLLVIALLAVAPAVDKLVPTFDYSKDTMRGGAVLKNEGKEESGLKRDYAFQWSYGKGETITLLVPNYYGACNDYNIGEKSKTYEVLRSSGQAKQFSKHAPMYWGAQPFTSGPVYVGAIVCFLFVLGLILVRGPERWWLSIAAVFALLLSWGHNLEWFNNFMFDHLPLYNKFRTPSMALVVTCLSMTILGALALIEIAKNYKQRKEEILNALYISLGVTGGLCLVCVLLGPAFGSFVGQSDAQLPGWLQDALIADRKAMLRADAFRSLIFIVLAAITLILSVSKQRLRIQYAIIVVGVLVLVDMWMVDKRFLNNDNFSNKRELYQMGYTFDSTPHYQSIKTRRIVPLATAINEQILKDTDPDYRVLNLTSNVFNESRTSYFHKSIGGYSPAKLRRYQDIIDTYFNGDINSNIINMLNTRYIIVNGDKGPMVQRNPEAMGNAWFVNDVQWMDSPNAEIEAIGNINLRSVATVDNQWKDKLELSSLSMHDSTAYIVISDYKNAGNIFYHSSSQQAGFAVFSEVFYKTWKAYIDGKEVPVVRTDYILRGIQIPAGEHDIEFRCVDELYVKMHRYSMMASIVIVVILLLLCGFGGYRAYKNRETVK